MPRKKTTTKKNKKVVDLTQADGKEEKIETVQKPRTLDQVWGDTGLWKYNTMEKEEYSNQLKEMNKSDLQAHASRIGLIPVEDRSVLTKRLITEFKNHVSKYKAQEKPKSNTVSKRGMKILEEGK